MMQRRQLLRLGACAALAGTGTRLWAAADARAPRFLLVFLRGGYDSANLLVPQGSSFYYESRPTIAVPRPGDAKPGAALPIDSNWGLAPALKDTLYPLYQQGQLAFVPFAGVDDLSRSHFETQDRIELGHAGDAHSSDFSSGFLNRLAQQLGAGQPLPPAAMAFTDQLPLVFRGPQTIGNQSLRQLSKPMAAQQAALIQSMYASQPLGAAVSDGFAVREEVSREMAQEMDAANRNAINAKGFELEARRIARLMRDKVQLGFVDVGGWDTHVGQGAGTGALADKFGALSSGLAGFAQEMGPQWDNTVVVVLSEFGRTFRENGNRGTDHGHGTVYWVLGGKVQGGALRGEQQQLTAKTLFQQRDYPVLNEYRAVLGGLFARLYGLDARRLDQVFAGARPRDIGLL